MGLPAQVLDEDCIVLVLLVEGGPTEACFLAQSWGLRHRGIRIHYKYLHFVP